MDKDIPALESETAQLANEIRDLIGKHISAFDENNYHQILTSVCIALCIEVGRLRWLATSTDEIDVDRFDRIFWEGVECHYNDNKSRFGPADH